LYDPITPPALSSARKDSEGGLRRHDAVSVEIVIRTEHEVAGTFDLDVHERTAIPESSNVGVSAAAAHDRTGRSDYMSIDVRQRA
jgi:hypothetical protein